MKNFLACVGATGLLLFGAALIDLVHLRIYYGPDESVRCRPVDNKVDNPAVRKPALTAAHPV